MKENKQLNQIPPDSPTMSPKAKKKNEATIFTIISGIEKDISELIQQSQIRSHKTKLFSINETLKNTLSKKLSNYNDLLADQEELIKLRVEMQSVKENYSKELDKLRKENDQLKKYLNNINNTSNPGASNNNISSNSDIMTILSEKDTKKDEIIKKYLNRIDTLNNQLNEEKIKNSKFQLSLKQYEDNYKTVLNDYNILLSRSDKKEVNDHIEKQVSELRKSNNEIKAKYEEVVKINSEIKGKFIESESNLRVQIEELRTLVKKNSAQQKKIEELEKDKEKITAELNYKEERLQALRQMNNKLEQKSSQILKKWETFKLFEEKTNQVSTNCNKLLEIIEDLNKKLSQYIEENNLLKNTIDNLNNENFNQAKKNEDLIENLKNLQIEKDDMYQKNFEMELNLKKYIESQKVDKDISKDKKINPSNNLATTIKSNKDKNNINNPILYPNEILKFDELRPAKVIIKDNNMIEIKNQ